MSSKKELARERVTRRGRVVYDRKRHFFDDRDLYRVTRSMLVRAGEDRAPGEPDIEPGAFFASIILTLIRGILEWFEHTGKIRDFLLGFLWELLPGILRFALKYQDIYVKLLRALWIWIGDILADANPKQDT
jgi:hypothetical protein